MAEAITAFDTECATSLHNNGLVSLLLGNTTHTEKFVSQFADRANKFNIARTEVAQHRLFDREAGGKRSGCEKWFISGQMIHAGVLRYQTCQFSFIQLIHQVTDWACSTGPLTPFGRSCAATAAIDCFTMRAASSS